MGRLEELFHEASEIAADERERFLAALESSEPELAAQLRQLLDADGEVEAMEQLIDGLLETSTSGGDVESAVDFDEELVGRRVGRYTIERVIGAGGMGVVCAAQQDEPRRSVALKLLHHGLTSAGSRERFQFESRVLSRLRHPGIAQVFEAGTDDSGGIPVPWISLELIEEARDLLTYATEVQLDRTARVELFCNVCDSVDHGHRRGIIHRDLKPSNILVGTKGEPKLIDFGIARALDENVVGTQPHTGTGAQFGTPEYMSPEQALGSRIGIDTRSDVYSLGVLLYRLLCGASPYRSTGSVPLESFLDITSRPPIPLAVRDRSFGGDLSTIASKALEKDPEARYATAGELSADLRRWMRHEPIVARPSGALRRLGLWARRRRAAASALVTILVVTVSYGFLLVDAWQGREVESTLRLLAAAEQGLLARNPEEVQERIEEIDQDGEFGWAVRFLRNEVAGGSLALCDRTNVSGDLSPSAVGGWVEDGEESHFVTWIESAGAGVTVSRLRDRQHPDEDPGYSTPYPASAMFLNDMPRVLMVEPDGRFCAKWLERVMVGTLGGTDSLLDRPIGKHFGVFALHPSPEFQYFAFLDRQLNVVRLDGATPPLEEEIDFSSIAFHPSEPIVVVGKNDGSVRMLRIDEQGQDLVELAILAGHAYHVHALAFDPRGDLLASGSNDGSIALWDFHEAVAADPERTVAPLCAETGRGPAEGVSTLSFHPSLPLLASGGVDGLLRSWRIVRPEEHRGNTWQLRHAGDRAGHANALRWSGFTSSGDRFATSDRRGVVREWAPIPCPDQLILDHRSSSVSETGLVVRENGKELIYTCDPYSVKFWDSRTGRKWGLIRPQSGKATNATVLPESRYVVMGMAHGSFELWEIESPAGSQDDFGKGRRLLAPRNILRGAGEVARGDVTDHASIEAAVLSDDHVRIAGCLTHGRFQIWDVNPTSSEVPAPDTLGRAAQDRTVTSGAAALHPDGSLFLLGVGGADPLVEVWDLDRDRSKPRRSIQLDSEPRAMAWKPGSQQFAVGLDNGVALIFDGPNGPPVSVSSKEDPAHEGSVLAVTFHPDEEILATGGTDRQIRLWARGYLDPIVTLRGHTSKVRSLAFDPSGERLLSGGSGEDGEDNVTRVWETIRARATLSELRARAEYWYLGQEARRRVVQARIGGATWTTILDRIASDEFVVGFATADWQKKLRAAARWYLEETKVSDHEVMRVVISVLSVGNSHEQAEAAVLARALCSRRPELRFRPAAMAAFYREGDYSTAAKVDEESDLDLRAQREAARKRTLTNEELLDEAKKLRHACQRFAFRALILNKLGPEHRDRAMQALGVAEDLLSRVSQGRAPVVSLVDEARRALGRK